MLKSSILHLGSRQTGHFYQVVSYLLVNKLFLLFVARRKEIERFADMEYLMR